jgi:hypothetical protein
MQAEKPTETPEAFMRRYVERRKTTAGSQRDAG